MAESQRSTTAARGRKSALWNEVRRITNGMRPQMAPIIRANSYSLFITSRNIPQLNLIDNAHPGHCHIETACHV